MYLFFESVWKLHIGEIPEKPKIERYSRKEHLLYDLNKYCAAIAAIKQNALTIQNPELLPVFPKPHINGFIIPKNFKPGEFYKWPGGYETKEKELWTSEREPASCFTTVAILTLPEEKKNTMENMTKEQYCEHCGNEIIEARYTSPTVKHRFCSTQCTEDFFEHKRRSFEEGESTSRGSAAKTERDDDVIIWGVQEKTEIGGFYMIGKRNSEQAGCIAYVCALDDARKICELLTASGSVAAPKEEDLLPEEILKKHFEAKGYIFDHFKNWLDFKVHLPTIYAAMGEYAAIHAHAQVMNQVNIMKQLKERDEALKELLPIAEQYRTKIDNPNWEDDFNKSKAIIEKARNLLSK